VTMPTYAMRLVRLGVISSWAVFSIHHAYEAGLAHSNGPIGIVVISSVILLATLALLERYERTGSQPVYALFSVVTLLWWVGATGLVEGFYGHVLKDILYFFFHVAPAALPRTSLGLTYDVPTNLFGEVTGVLPFVFAILVAVAWFRLEVQRRAEAAARRGQQANAGG
jgi:cellobiose-specific phosphotransferase system component IIC